MEFIDDGGFSNARISCNEHQFRSAALDDAVEGGEQLLDLALSPVQFLGNQQPVWRVVFAKRELVDAMLRFPFSKTAPKIACGAGRGLIALLSSFGEQLHDDCRHRARNALQPLAGRYRLS